MKTTAAAVLLAATFVACGDDGPSPRTELLPAEPVAMSTDLRGLTLAATNSLAATSVLFTADQAAAPNLVLHEQVYSEFVHARVGGQPRAAEPRFDSRIDAIYSHATFGPLVAGATNLYWLVDLQRLDREWLVDWNGLERDEPDTRAGSLTFSVRRDQNDSDYQDAVIERVVGAFTDADPRPASIILGAEMERYYASVPEDWPAFGAFVRDIADALRAVDPAVRVGVGINWSNFVEDVVPRFVESSGQTTVNFQALRAAWEAVLDPLYLRTATTTVPTVETALDFYAFAAIPDPDRFVSPAEVPQDHFAGVHTYFDEFPDKELPVAWFAVGWPSEQTSTGSFGDWWEFFVAHAGGAEIELVTWWGYGNLIDDSDCRTMTDVLGLTRAACYRGLYTSSGSPISGLRDEYFGE